MEELRCPVCTARFRGAAVCSRCGADLERLMWLALQAWRWREAARKAILSGQFAAASELATKAQEMQGTSSGEFLKKIGAWLALSFV